MGERCIVQGGVARTVLRRSGGRGSFLEVHQSPRKPTKAHHGRLDCGAKRVWAVVGQTIGDPVTLRRDVGRGNKGLLERGNE